MSNANALTYKQIIDVLQSIAERHYQINTFYLGEPHDMNTEDIIYPVFQVYPYIAKLPQTNGEYKTIDLTIKCKLLDNDRQDNVSQLDVYSDTLRIAQDIINEINQHPFYIHSNITLLGDITIGQLNEYEDDFLTGWEWDLNLQLINTNSFCGLPLADIPGYSIAGPNSSGQSISWGYLTCESITGCTNLTNFIQNIVNEGTANNTFVQNGINTFTGGTNVNPTVNVTGGTFNSISAITFSAGTINSGSTNLYDIFITTNDGNDITRVQPGLNIYTGGTPNNPSVNLSAATLNYLSATTISGGTIYSGSTNLSTIITQIVTGTSTNTSIANGLNTYTGGTASVPSINVSGGTVNNWNVTGGTLASGSTDLYNVFITKGSAVLGVEPGLNTYTGGTANNPTINISAATLVYLSATSVSATTFYSGSTNLNDIINTAVSAATTNLPQTSVQNGTNTFTGGTQSHPTINITGGTLNNLNITGGTLSSGGTDLYNIFITTNDGNDITRVEPGTNTYTGGTPNNPTINISAATLNLLTVSGATSLASVSATTIYSGSTDLYNIFAQLPDQNDITRVQPGTNITTGGTGNNPTINLVASPSINNLTWSGTATGGALSATSISASTKIFSAGTNLESIIYSIAASTEDITRVQPGLNTYTAGTVNNPSVNVSAATLNYLSATTISGGTIYSGSTDLNVYFNQDRAQINTKANRSGDTFTGQVNAPAFSATTISGGTIYSGTTDIYNIFAKPALVVNNVNAGTNIQTGGTAISPTISTVASPSFNNITWSGTATGNALSATTISGGTIYSGSTNLYDIFRPNDGSTSGQFMQIYSSNDTWTAPSGCSSVTLEMWGGGGGAGGGGRNSGAGTYLGGGGGAAGAYFMAQVPVTPGTTYTIKIGSGGTGGYAFGPSTGQVYPTNGGNTTFANMIASGGTSGTNATVITSPGTNGTGGTALYVNGHPSDDIVYTSAYFFSRGYDGVQAQGVPSSSDNSGGAGGDATMFGRVKYNPDITGNGTGGNTPNTSTPQLGGNATLIAGGGAGGNGAFDIGGGVWYGYSGGSGTAGLLILKWNDGGGGTLANGNTTIVSNGRNITTGNTQNNPTINLVDSPSINNLTFSGTATGGNVYGTVVSGGTLYSGATDIYTIFAKPALVVNNVNAGSNITTGGTAISPTINLTASPSVNNIIISGTANINIVSATTLTAGTTTLATTTATSFSANTVSANTLSAATIYSASTSLYSIFQGINQNSVIGNGTNTYTAGTFYNQTVNVSALTINTLTASGATSLATVSATTYISGSTDLYNIFAKNTDVCRVQPGLNTYTGGTATSPTVNVSALTINTLTASGASSFTTTLSAATLSAATMISGSTNLYSIFDSKTNSAEFSIAISDEITAISSGTGKVIFYAPYAFTITNVYASLSQSGSTNSVFDVKMTGTTIFSSSPRMVVDLNTFHSNNSAFAVTITGTTVAAFSKISLDILTGGTGAKGAKIYILGTKTL